MIDRLLILGSISTVATLAALTYNTGHRRRIEAVAGSVIGKVMVFTSPTCAACRAQRRFLDHLDADEATRIEYVDVHREPELAARFGIMTLPTSVFFDDGGTVAHIAHGLIDTAAFRRRLRG